MGIPAGYTRVGSATIDGNGSVGNIWDSIGTVQKGALGIVELSGIPSYLGPILDAWGAEQTVQGAFMVAGVDATVTECSWEGGKGYIRFRGSPFAVIPFLYALGAAALALGILAGVITVGFFIYEFAKEPGKFVLPFAVIGLLVIGGLLVVGSGEKKS